MAGPEGVLAEARLVTVEGHSRWLLPAAEMLLKGLGLDVGALDALRRHHGAGLLHRPAGGPGKRAGPRSGERAPLRRPADARRPGRRGGRGLGHGRGPRRRLPGRGVLGRLRRVGPSPPTARRRAAGRGAGGTARGGGVRRGRGPRAPRGDPGRRSRRRVPALARFPRGAARRSPRCGWPPPASRCPPPACGRSTCGASTPARPRREARPPPAASGPLGRARPRCARGGLLHPPLDAGASPRGGRTRPARHGAGARGPGGPGRGAGRDTRLLLVPSRRGRDARDERGRATRAAAGRASRVGSSSSRWRGRRGRGRGARSWSCGRGTGRPSRCTSRSAFGRLGVRRAYYARAHRGRAGPRPGAVRRRILNWPGQRATVPFRGHGAPRAPHDAPPTPTRGSPSDPAGGADAAGTGFAHERPQRRIPPT